jgi:hypothetical protein
VDEIGDRPDAFNPIGGIDLIQPVQDQRTIDVARSCFSVVTAEPLSVTDRLS